MWKVNNELRMIDPRLHFRAAALLALVIGILSATKLDALQVDQHPRVPGSRWQMFATPGQAGFAPTLAEEFDDICESSGAAGVIIVFDGAVLLRFGDVETRFMCHSVRKSLMSIMYGMAVDRQAIDLDKSLADLAIGEIEPGLSENEKLATVSDLLKSRSGVYHKSAYEPSHMQVTRPARGSHRPGENWFYNNWDFNALLTIYEQETGEKIFESFQRRIAEPLQLQDFRRRDGYYHLEPERSMHPAYPFRMSARDLARVGWLMALGGRWGDQQLVSKEWIGDSTTAHSEIRPWHRYDGYGFMWWIAELNGEKIYSALGNGGNSIDVFPEERLVFSFRADTYRGQSISFADRWRIMRLVLDARQGRPSTEPELMRLPEKNLGPQPAALTAEYLEQFPLELRRQLPAELPAEIRDEPVRIELVGSTLVLYTRRPPALQFDLIPLGNDRFWIEGFREIGVIDRDGSGQPTRFLMRDDLLQFVRELEKAGKIEEAIRQRRLAETLFEPG